MFSFLKSEPEPELNMQEVYRHTDTQEVDTLENWVGGLPMNILHKALRYGILVKVDD